MKTFNLKIKVIFFSFAFMLGLPEMLFNQTTNAVYSQSEALLNNTWSFIEGNIDGQVLNSPTDFNGGFDSLLGDYFEFFFSSSTSQCFGFNIIYFDVSDNQFSLAELFDIQPNTCEDPDILNFIDLHNSFFVELPLESNGNPKNPFIYNIEDFGNYNVLHITNNLGDWVKYNSGFLSNHIFTQNIFTLFPNPTKKTLYVNNNFNQKVQTNVFDLNGKLQQTHFIEAGQSQIDVNQLQSGLYFVVFESETGERVSKKFIKY